MFEGNRRPARLVSNRAEREGKNFKIFGKRSEMRAVWRPEVRLDIDDMDAAVLFGGEPLGTSSI